MPKIRTHFEQIPVAAVMKAVAGAAPPGRRAVASRPVAPARKPARKAQR